MHIYTYVFTISALLHVLPAYPMLLSACKVQMARPVAPVAHSFRSMSSDKQPQSPLSKIALDGIGKKDAYALSSFLEHKFKDSIDKLVDSCTLEDMEHFAGASHTDPHFKDKLTVVTYKLLSPGGSWYNLFIQYTRMQASLLQVEKSVKDISDQLPDAMRLSSLPLHQSSEKKIIETHERAIKELTDELRTMIDFGKSFNQAVVAEKKALDDERQRKRDEKIKNSSLSEL